MAGVTRAELFEFQHFFAEAARDRNNRRDGHESRRHMAAERLDHGLVRRDADVIVGWPRADGDAGRALRRHPRQCAGVVAPQPHNVAAARKVGCQAPAHADVPEVVDDTAEQIPVHRRIIAMRRAPMIPEAPGRTRAAGTDAHLPA